MMQAPDEVPHPADTTADDTVVGDTQPTQQAGQPPSVIDQHLWGYLQPCSKELARLDFWKAKPTYTIGRSRECSMTLTGFKVSNMHCTLTWDGKEEGGSTVTVQDHSSNGTFLNGQKIGKNCTRILLEGNEIAFGTCQQQLNASEDYRYIYRHTADGLPNEGLHAHYDISTQLGKGSFATVVKAVHRATGQWFAVKMIHTNKIRATGTGTALQGSEDNKNAFAREISILEGLRHPNICQLKETFFDKANINLVLEFVRGGDLLDYILKREGLRKRNSNSSARERSLSPGDTAEEETKNITYQICDALAYIHSAGIAHRDLKPENVLLTDDNPPRVKVADFGLAKAVDSLTMLRTMCGTPSYLAPEVVMQKRHEGYTQLVDSWSVGVIVFSMLTNVSPFIEDDQQPDLRIRIAGRMVDWGTLAASGVSEEAQDFNKKLLDNDPTIRMTLDKARYHPWLHSYGPPAPYKARTLTSTHSIDSFTTDADPVATDSSMASASDMGFLNDGEVDEGAVSGFQNLHLSHSVAPSIPEGSTSTLLPNIPGALSNGQTARNGIRREGSRALQRRSDVMSQVADGESTVPSPPSDMIADAMLQDSTRAPTNDTRGNKRVHSELTPLPEDMGDDRSPLGQLNSPRKKGRPAEASATPAARKGSRAKGKEVAEVPPRSTRSRSSNVSGGDESGDQRPRRSTRQTQLPRAGQRG